MTVRIITGDCREVLPTLPAASVHCVVTSPPYYGLRSYGRNSPLGLEPRVADYVANVVAVMREIRRVLRDDGTAWLNLGDSYANNAGFIEGAQPNRARDGLKPKDIVGVPWRVAFALQAAGWWLRQDIVWAKPNPMPESVCDRCTRAHEYIFLLAKSESYYFDAEAISEPSVTGDNRKPFAAGQVDVRGDGHDRGGGSERTNGIRDASRRNKRSVWEVATQSFDGAHFAVFPPALILPCILAGCPVGGTVLDPFAGAGTTGLVADRCDRNAVLIEFNAGYAALAARRIKADSPLFAKVESDSRIQSVATTE